MHIPGMEAEIRLNEEMLAAWDFIENTGTSVFLTGKAGTGKTTLLRYVREHTAKTCVVTAPTGVAAINAGGVTLHSFFQLPLTPYVPGTQVKSNFRFSREKLRIIRALDLLIIDEVSMVRSDLLDAVDATLRRLRRSVEPFGGVQLLLIGDLQQLAPVVTPRDDDMLRGHYTTPYFFGSQALGRTSYVTVGLRHVFRQQNPEFVSLLNHVRDNRLTHDDRQRLASLCRPGFEPGPDEGYIRLTTHNRQADSYNQQRLESLQAKAFTYSAHVDRDFPESFFPTDERLTLKVGAQVMFIKNDSGMEHRYYNGKIGRVTYLDRDTVRVTCLDDGIEVDVEPAVWENTRYEVDEKTNTVEPKVEGTFSQLPLRLAWAITIHKSQGLTFNRAVIDAGQAFAPGQVYVALSRCRTLDGLVLATPLHGSMLTGDPEVLHYISGQTAAAQRSLEALALVRSQYRRTLLRELFDFSGIGGSLYRLRTFAGERLGKGGMALASAMSAAEGDMQSDITDIALRWQAQIAAMSDTDIDSESIRTRIDGACKYFRSKLATDLVGPLDILEQVKPGARLNAERWKELYADYRQALGEKMLVLEAMLGKPFNTGTYLTARRQAVLEAGSHKKARKVKVSVKKRPKKE